MLQGIFTEYDLSKQDMKQVSFFHSLYFDKIGFFDNAYSHKVVRENPDHFILFLCTKGKGYLEHHGIRYNISAGNIFFTFPGVAHAYGADESDPWSIYWAHFHTDSPEFVSILKANHISVFQPVFYTQAFQDIAESFQFILTDIYHAAPCEFQYKQSIFTQLVFQSFTLANQPNQKNKYVSAALEYIHSHLNHPLSLEEIANAVHISKFYLSHHFTTDLGVSIKQYVLTKKMNQAKFLLTSTCHNISEIASLCGYQNSMYFSYAFKKQTGISPKNYRMRNLDALP